MGQKVIPISLRLKKKENWHSKWIIEKNNYSNLLHFDLEIRKYFEILYNYKNLKLIDIKIKRISNNIHIYVYINQQSINFYRISYHKIINNLNLYYPNNNIKIFIKNIKVKDLKKLKKTIKQIFFILKKRNKLNKKKRQMIYCLSYSLYTKNINIISFFIKKYLQRKKSHKKLIKEIDMMFQKFFKLFSNFIGYRLQFKGRLNGSKRKRKSVYQKGKIPLNTLKDNIYYHFNEFKTPSGICSIKIWIFLKKKN